MLVIFLYLMKRKITILRQLVSSVCSLAVTWTEQMWGQIGVMALSPAVNRWTLMDNSVITLRLEAV